MKQGVCLPFCVNGTPLRVHSTRHTLSGALLAEYHLHNTVSINLASFQIA